MNNTYILGLALISLAACKGKSDDKASPGGGSSASPTSAAPTAGKLTGKAPAAASCPADTTKNDGGFCIKLPDGWKEDAQQTAGMYGYSSPDRGDGVSVKVQPYSEGTWKDWQNWQKQGVQTVVEEGDLDGGGHWIISDDNEGARWISAIAHGPGYMVECTTHVDKVFMDKPEHQAALATCKTVTAL